MHVFPFRMENSLFVKVLRDEMDYEESLLKVTYKMNGIIWDEKSDTLRSMHM